MNKAARFHFLSRVTITLGFATGISSGMLHAAETKTKLMKILVLDKSQYGANGHMESRRDLNNALKELGKEKGFTVKIIGQDDNASTISTEFSAANLATYQAVLFSNNDGVHAQLSSSDKTNFENYVKNGGGFIPIHAASASISNWPWITSMLVESFYGPHGNNQPTANVMHDAEGNKDGTESKGIFKGLTAPLAFLDEYYSFRTSPRGKAGVTILLTIDEKSLNKTLDGAMGNDHPVVWSKTEGKGRVLHFSMGHSWSTNNVYTAKNNYLKNFMYSSLRYVAGDFLGCMDSQSQNYNPEATKNNPADCELSSIHRVTFSSDASGSGSPIVSQDSRGYGVRVGFYSPGPHELTLVDMAGHTVYKKEGRGQALESVPHPSKPGLYVLKAKAEGHVTTRRVTVL
jgi:type 1 glutamine amidotransferase